MTTVDLEQQRLLIGGEWTEAGGGGTFERTDPFTGDAVTVAAAAGREDARKAVEAAAAAFPAWAATPPGERRALLNAAADKLMEAAPDIAGVMTEEVGGTFGWGMFNCDLAARMLREAAAQAYSVVGEVIPSDVPGSLAMGVRQPAGVVVGMAPWNAPVILSTRAVATPLAYGNTVVLKASEQCPRTHAAVVRALVDAGLPAGTVNLIIHAPDDAPDVVDELIAHPATRRVNFTGSTKVGKIIALKCAEHLTRCLLELGGKAPQVVLARRRPRGRRRRRQLRRVHELRPDLHVDGADRGRQLGRRRPRREARGARRQAHHRRPARPGHDDRPGHQRRLARARARADRGRARQGRRGAGRRRGRRQRRRARRCWPASRPRCASTARSRSARS